MYNEKTCQNLHIRFQMYYRSSFIEASKADKLALYSGWEFALSYIIAHWKQVPSLIPYFYEWKGKKISVIPYLEKLYVSSIEGLLQSTC